MSNDSRVDLISSLRKEGNYSDALMVANDMISENTQWYLAYNLRARIFYEMGNYKEAFGDIEQLVALRPHSPSAYFERAGWNIELGNFINAIKDISVVKKINDPYFSDASNFYLALAHIGTGDTVKAMEACLHLPANYISYFKLPEMEGRLFSRDDLYCIAKTCRRK